MKQFTAVEVQKLKRLAKMDFRIGSVMRAQAAIGRYPLSVTNAESQKLYRVAGRYK
jgi:hypothetical protein